MAEFQAVAHAVTIIKCMYVARETEGLTSAAVVVVVVVVKRQSDDREGHVLRSEAPGEILRVLNSSVFANTGVEVKQPSRSHGGKKSWKRKRSHLKNHTPFFSFFLSLPQVIKIGGN